MNKPEGVQALRITAYYMLFAGLWITISDLMLAMFIPEAAGVVRWQMYKGWLFVLATGILLYWVLFRVFHRRVRYEKRLIEAHHQLSAVIQASPLAIITLDSEGRVMTWNPAAETMFGWREIEVLGRDNPIIPEKDVLAFRKVHLQAIQGKQVCGAEVIGRKKDGTDIDMSLSTAVVKNTQDEPGGIVAVIADITEQKRKEEQLRFLSLYDALTGIYNRTYFEQEMKRLEASRATNVGMIICDVDGLKLYNDSLGHQLGDELLTAAARIIKSCFRESDVVARIGGDEFAVLLPDSDLPTIEDACTRIRDAIVDFNKETEDYHLSLSIGYAVSKGPLSDLFKEADNNMYREKSRRNENVRHATIHFLMKALTTRDFILDGHTDRMEDMVAGLAQEVGMPSNKIPDVRLFARYHDIGKVGIPESLLLKSEPLLPQEMNEIKRHPEIGHRIALSAPELAHVADWILKHHEWWDGQGYPLGLRGNDIPLECRILAIADAFDALTTKRPYSEPKGQDEAFEELRIFAGKQFDPNLVAAFIDMMQTSEYQNIPETK
jgi:diguanylate cyclase (GGDEF)-like protein/PAS domain S-box-containing protein